MLSNTRSRRNGVQLDPVLFELGIDVVAKSVVLRGKRLVELSLRLLDAQLEFGPRQLWLGHRELGAGIAQSGKFALQLVAELEVLRGDGFLDIAFNFDYQSGQFFVRLACKLVSD